MVEARKPVSLQCPWEIFDKPASGSEVKNGEGARNVENPTRRFFASAEIVDQKHGGFEFLSQDNGTALTGVQVRQTRIGKGSDPPNLQPIGAITDLFLHARGSSFILKLGKTASGTTTRPYKAFKRLTWSMRMRWLSGVVPATTDHQGRCSSKRSLVLIS